MVGHHSPHSNCCFRDFLGIFSFSDRPVEQLATDTHQTRPRLDSNELLGPVPGASGAKIRMLQDQHKFHLIEQLQIHSPSLLLALLALLVPVQNFSILFLFCQGHEIWNLWSSASISDLDWTVFFLVPSHCSKISKIRCPQFRGSENEEIQYPIRI